MFNLSPVGISIVDSERNLIESNKAHGKIIRLSEKGLKTSSCLNRKYINSVGKEMMPDEFPSSIALREKRLVKNIEVGIVGKDNKVFWTEVSAVPFDDEGKYAVLVTQDINDRKKAEIDLIESQKRLQKLTIHMEDIRENERSQIALNLHDDLGQKLIALTLDIAWMKSRMGVQSQALRQKLEDMSLMLIESIESIKEISSSLRPSMLFDLGLVPALDSLLSKFKKQFFIPYQFNYDREEFEIDNRISLIIYRIVEESLTNIARHSEASSVEVNLSFVKNRIELLIKDNGIGIGKDVVNSFTSMGIAVIKERVRSVHGKVLIIGEKGSGTIIKVSIPFKKKAK